MPSTIKIQPFFDLIPNVALFDVRSEAEYEHAHIPGAVNVPLLNNENRIIVGTVYKQEGKEAAISRGFELVGPLFGEFYAKINAIANGRPALFYCWRGGLRSNISASVYEWGGHKTQVLFGGYKAYRRAVLEGFKQPLQLKIISGFTGVGKTEILHLLQQNGAQVIDLEEIARHKGSALGGLGMPPQLSNEMFENIMFEKWRNMDSKKAVFVENESRKIGANVIPEAVWFAMQKAPLIDVLVDRETRLRRILSEYGGFEVADLEYCTIKIKKRLGGLFLKNALDALYSGDIETWATILMDYYDRTYLHSRKDLAPADKPGLPDSENDIIQRELSEFVWDWENVNSSLEAFIQKYN